MITEALFNSLFLIVQWVISLAPDLSSVTWPSGFVAFIDLMSYGFYFVPLSTFVFCFAVVFIIQNANIAWAIFEWILRRIPTQN